MIYGSIMICLNEMNCKTYISDTYNIASFHLFSISNSSGFNSKFLLHKAIFFNFLHRPGQSLATKI